MGQLGRVPDQLTPDPSAPGAADTERALGVLRGRTRLHQTDTATVDARPPTRAIVPAKPVINAVLPPASPSHDTTLLTLWPVANSITFIRQWSHKRTHSSCHASSHSLHSAS